MCLCVYVCAGQRITENRIMKETTITIKHAVAATRRQKWQQRNTNVNLNFFTIVVQIVLLPSLPLTHTCDDALSATRREGVMCVYVRVSMYVCAAQCCHVQNGHCCEMFFRLFVHCRHHWNKIATPALTLTAASVAVAAAAAATAGASRGTKNVGRISRPSTVLSLFLFPSSAHVGAAIGRATRPAAICRGGGDGGGGGGSGNVFSFACHTPILISVSRSQFSCDPISLKCWQNTCVCVHVCVECACAFVKCEWYKGNVEKYEGSASETCESP